MNLAAQQPKISFTLPPTQENLRSAASAPILLRDPHWQANRPRRTLDPVVGEVIIPITPICDYSCFSCTISWEMEAVFWLPLALQVSNLPLHWNNWVVQEEGQTKIKAVAFNLNPPAVAMQLEAIFEEKIPTKHHQVEKERATKDHFW